MTIVTYHHRPERARKKRFPVGRIVSARPPKKRHGEIPYGVPDDAERSRRIAAFLERTLGPQD